MRYEVAASNNVLIEMAEVKSLAARCARALRVATPPLDASFTSTTRTIETDNFKILIWQT